MYVRSCSKLSLYWSFDFCQDIGEDICIDFDEKIVCLCLYRSDTQSPGRGSNEDETGQLPIYVYITLNREINVYLYYFA